MTPTTMSRVFARRHDRVGRALQWSAVLAYDGSCVECLSTARLPEPSRRVLRRHVPVRSRLPLGPGDARNGLRFPAIGVRPLGPSAAWWHPFLPSSAPWTSTSWPSRSASMQSDMKWGNQSVALKGFFSDPGSTGITVALRFFPLDDNCASSSPGCVGDDYVLPLFPWSTLPQNPPGLTQAIDDTTADGVLHADAGCSERGLARRARTGSSRRRHSPRPFVLAGACFSGPGVVLCGPWPHQWPPRMIRHRTLRVRVQVQLRGRQVRVPPRTCAASRRRSPCRCQCVTYP